MSPSPRPPEDGVLPAGTDTVLVGGCDINGQLRAKRLPAWRFAEDSAESPVTRLPFASGIFGMDLDDDLPQPPEGFPHWHPSWADGYGDIVGVLDMSTMRPVPWLDRTALVLCDFTFDDGRPLPISPRHVLRRIIGRYDRLGLEPRVAPEYEFTILRENEESLATKGYRDLNLMSPSAQMYGALRATADGGFADQLRALVEEFGIPVEAWVPEGGRGQYELNVPHADALTAADRGFLLKQAVKEITLRHGMVATFMSRPTVGRYGNGLHLNASLRTPEGTSATVDHAAPGRLSPVFRRFLAGQLAVLREFTVLLCPTVNDYKRLTPESAAGTTVSWGYDNKTVSLRLLTPRDESKWRVEHRTAGAAANPYLAIAAVLAGGAYGIEEELELPEPRTGNVYRAPDVEPLPSSLSEATDLFERSAVARRYFGDEFVDFYAATRRHEQRCFEQAITDWELRRYLLKG